MANIGDRRRRVLFAEKRAKDGEAGGEDADVAFDVDPDAHRDGGPGYIGEFKLSEEGNADDAGDADTEIRLVETGEGRSLRQIC